MRGFLPLTIYSCTVCAPKFGILFERIRSGITYIIYISIFATQQLQDTSKQLKKHSSYDEVQTVHGTASAMQEKQIMHLLCFVRARSNSSIFRDCETNVHAMCAMATVYCTVKLTLCIALALGLPHLLPFP